MKLANTLFLAATPFLAAASVSAEGFGGFVDAKVRTLGREETPQVSGVEKWLPLTLVELRGTNWSEKRILRHVERTAGILGACGVGLGPVTLVAAKTPDGRHDLDMKTMHPKAGTPLDVFRIARLLPRDARWPVAFFVGRLLGDETPARSYGRGDAGPGNASDYPYMNTAWFAYKSHWIERRDERYSSLAHELVHLLCECGHVEDDEPHMMNTHRNMLSSKILPAHCEEIRSSPLLTPTAPFDLHRNP